MGVSIVMKCVASYSQRRLRYNAAIAIIIDKKEFYTLYITKNTKRFSFKSDMGGKVFTRRLVRSDVVTVVA